MNLFWNRNDNDNNKLLKPVTVSNNGNNIGNNKNNSSSLMPPPPTTNISKSSTKVRLQPGFGPLDWAKLKSSNEDLRKVDWSFPIPISPKMMSRHRRSKDSFDDEVWSSFKGKVYNITSYLPFHPGGEKDLLRVAGKDGTDLFMRTHAWVNIDYMLDECLIGFLVPNGKGLEDSLLDDDD